MSRAGDRSDLVVFEKRTVTVNGAGQSVITWAPDELLAARGEVWCEATRNTETNARFVSELIDGVTPASHRLIWDGIIWTITNAVHDRKRAILMIESDFSQQVEATHMLSTEREFIDGEPILRERE